jgi:general secretion pathway protein D
MSQESFAFDRSVNGSPLDGTDAEIFPNQSSESGGVTSGRGDFENAAIERAEKFGAKEARKIGMTRGNPLLTVRLCWFVNRTWLAALTILLAGLAFGTPAHAQSASSWNKRGQAAELREDYDTAYEAYLKAHEKSPKDMRYTARLDRMRFQAAAAHVDRGRVLRQSGDLSGALNQFTRALQIDPGNEAAAQEIKITEAQDKLAGSAALGPTGTAESRTMLSDVAGIRGPVDLKPVSDDPITLHMVEDSKNIYTAIGKLAGLNVLFDPDYQSKRIPVDLTNVSLADALRIVGTIAGTFYKPVTSDTIFVAQNNRQKHTDLDDLAVQTFYLTNPSQQSDANEVYTALRNMLPADVKSYLVPSQNAIIVRGTRDDLTLAEKLLNDLDRTKAEVVVDVAILEVNRDKIRNLGITLPQTFGITPQVSPNSTNTVAGTTTGTTATASAFTLNTLANINATNFAVTIGGGTLNALLTDADTRVLQNPSIRATDGQQATLKIGSKIPVATGSYSAGAATGITAGIGVQTQFTYLDVGVNIDMTPTIHLDREVSLKLNVEVLSQTSSVTISGVTEPVIGQRSDKTTIQLKDGEPCLLAGILTKMDNSTNSGTPGLSDIPFLKYFFGSVNHEVQQDEVVFVLIPHIVRESVLTRLNTRKIDTGTQNDIEIRRSTNPADGLLDAENAAPLGGSKTTAANAASAMVQQMKQQAMPPTPPGVSGAGVSTITTSAGPVSEPAVAGPPVQLTVTPGDSTQPLGSTFAASVVLSNAHDVYSVPLQVQFDPKVLQLVNVDAGGLLGGDGQPVALVHKDDGNGLVTIQASRPPGVNGVNGQGQVCILTFKAIGAGDSSIALVKVGAKNSVQASLPATGGQAVVHVK